jgi:DegV family protein with EDD domain
MAIAMTVALVSDSCHYLPRDTIADLELHQVPLYVHAAGVARRETDITDYAEYYRSLDTTKDLPTTSQPSVGDFLAVYEPLLEDGGEIISIHLSGGLSGTVRSAEQARDHLGADGARVHVVDSNTAAGGLGMMLIAANAALRAGEGVEGALARAQEAREHLRLRFAMDTLEYIRRGGRIGEAQAWLGTALQIKPILTVESEIAAVARVRTTKKALANLLDVLAEAKADGCDGWFVHHIQAPDRAQQLVAAGTELFGSAPVLVAEVGPVLGTHVGPGTTAVGAVPRRLLVP